MNEIESVVIQVKCGMCKKILTKNIDNEGSDIIICDCGNEVKIIYELEAYW